jgi:phosphoenolpyruvate carboxykinase (GTP)
MLPKIFNVNWFRKNSEGKFLWPGYGDNIRALKWIFERLEGADNAVETPIGYVPKTGSIDIEGLIDVDKNMPEILKVDKNEWLAEAELITTHYATFGGHLPSELTDQFEALKGRLLKS